jgi:predicted amidophosphoribosyltransferase
MTQIPTLDATPLAAATRRRGHAVAAALADLLLDRGCAGCGHGDRLLCPSCVGALGGPAYPAMPTPAPAGLPVPWAVGAYAGVVRDVVLAHKEHGRLALAGPLGDALATAVDAAAADHEEILVVPVPSRRSAVRARGHDAVARTARAAARALRRRGRVVQVLPVLRIGRRLADQAGLTSAARRANLAGALVVPEGLHPLLIGRHIVVVDDVVTTGSTLAEAVRAVVPASPASVAVAVVAATARQSAPMITESERS